MWVMPAITLGLCVAAAIPLGYYMSWLMDREGAANRWERLLDTGPQDWKSYGVSMIVFNLGLFVVGFAVLAAQPILPGNPDGKGMLAASTLFHTAASFLTNTNLQHYSGEVHLSYASQLLAIAFKQFVTPAVGLCALAAVIRGLRGDSSCGNFALDLWRGVVYLLLPMSTVFGIFLIWQGVPMTMEGAAIAETLSGGTQTVARGPVAAIEAIKQLGTNGGGFFGTNSAHPFENPNALTNIFETVAILLIPMACVVMFGRMLRSLKQALVVFGVMSAFLLLFLAVTVVFETSVPNPSFIAHPITPDDPQAQEQGSVRYAVGLPLEGQGNWEGKETRFGASASPTWAAITTSTSNGSVNSMHDSLHPFTVLVTLSGMWLNCIFGGVGVGLINFLVYTIIAIFLAGLMVGRTPEYLGKKIHAKEMKLAMLALLVHPIAILGPTALAFLSDWGPASFANPGSHGFTEVLYEFTSASANNGSGLEGLGDTHGFADAASPAAFAWHWDLSTGIIMIICRFIPIIAPLALAAGLAQKPRIPMTVGTLKTDTVLFGCWLAATIFVLGALLFLPVAALGPFATAWGPIPYGG